MPGRPIPISASTLIRIGLTAAIFAVLVLYPEIWNRILPPLFPDLSQHLYQRTSFLDLVLEHGSLVLVSSGMSVLIGIGLGIFVTRAFGRDFLPVVNSMVSVGQTFPPVAVLALAVPAVGFGAAPTIIALFLYGLLPVVRNTIAGIESIPGHITEAAQGMGMTGTQILTKVELRMALPVIMAGIRTSVIINIGTATLGATIGAGGLGAPIIAGLIGQNPAFVLEGAAVAGLFAVLADAILEGAEESVSPAR
ncbi:MAG: ABC transporter permease [Desulfovibrionales bacterium]